MRRFYTTCEEWCLPQENLRASRGSNKDGEAVVAEVPPKEREVRRITSVRDLAF